MLSGEIVDFLGIGLSVVVGSRDKDNLPDCVRAAALAVLPDRKHVAVFVPEATQGQLANNLADNGRIALVATLPYDHRSLQLKGEAVSYARAPDADRGTVEAYLARFAGVLEPLGMPRDVIMRVNHWPALRVEVRIDELYVQTPGPGAGTKLTGGTL